MAFTSLAVIGAGLAIKGSIDAGSAIEDASQAQQSSAEASLAFAREQFEEVKKGLQPFITGGQPAFEMQQALSGALGPEAQAAAFQQFQESPGTQFLREQGLRLSNANSAASGGLGGGERLRELTRFSQGLALQDLGGTFSRLGSVSGAGLAAAQALGGVSGQASAVQAGLMSQAGAAQASGILGSQQAQAQGLQQLFGFLPAFQASSLGTPSVSPGTGVADGFIPRF